MPEKMNRAVLMLNASYEPINICSVKRALTLVLKGFAVTEEDSGLTVRSMAGPLPLPAVIRLRNYRRVPRHTRALSRKNIFIRDGNRCGYCSQHFASKELTLDHIQPKSRRGPSTWDNLISSCVKCNNAKGDRTPEEAGMPLLKRPAPFSIHTSRNLLRTMGDSEVQWQKYLFFQNQNNVAVA